MYHEMLMLSALGATSSAVCLILSKFAYTLGLVDHPQGRKTHDLPTPVVGGLSIYVVVCLGLLAFEFPSEYWKLMAAACVIVTVGAADDIFFLNIKIRLFAQAVSVLLVLSSTSIWLDDLSIGSKTWDSYLTFAGIPITVFSVVGLINAFNMVDGIDGLASANALTGLIIFSGAVFLLSGYSPNHFNWIILLTTSICGFLVVNLGLTPMTKVFLGDSGSMLLGFLVSWTVIFLSHSTGDGVLPFIGLWCFCLPIFDAFSVIVRRYRSGVSVFSPDRTHLHHILINSGIPSRRVLGMILLIATVLAFAGVVVTLLFGQLFSLLAFLACSLLYFVAVSRVGRGCV